MLKKSIEDFSSHCQVLVMPHQTFQEKFFLVIPVWGTICCWVFSVGFLKESDLRNRKTEHHKHSHSRMFHSRNQPRLMWKVKTHSRTCTWRTRTNFARPSPHGCFRSSTGDGNQVRKLGLKPGETWTFSPLG